MFRCPLGCLLCLIALPVCAQHVKLAASHPADQATGVLLSDSLHLRFSDAVDVESLESIRLQKGVEVAGKEITDQEITDQGDGGNVDVRRSTDLTGASITIVPTQFLAPNQSYRIVGERGLRAVNGTPIQPFVIEFHTGNKSAVDGAGLRFAAQTFDKTRSMTTVLFGPDRKLYAASAFGEIACWDVDATGKPSNRTVVFQDPTRSRQFIDLEWDPRASSDDLVLWVSYAERLTAKTDPRYFFTGKISRLRIGDSKILEEHVVVSGLPHGREVQGGHETLPHQPNGLCFKEGMLYQSVGSTSSSGGPANWGIPEQLLSGCVLEIDYQRIGDQTVDVFPGSGTFDPFAKSSLIKHFATGVRNALEILAHSNGRLYTAVNINDRGKRSDGVPDDPDIPGDQNELIKMVTPDHESLFILQRGRHYGFPNPTLGHYVLNGGNPTKDEDPFEIADYPVGTMPEDGFAPELMYPIWRWGGTSPNGMIEYRPPMEHPLASAILCCFYSAGDVAAMVLGDDGMPVQVAKLRGERGKLQFTGPLDITQDTATGSLYVSDFGKQSAFGSDGSMVWLRPILGSK